MQSDAPVAVAAEAVVSSAPPQSSSLEMTDGAGAASRGLWGLGDCDATEHNRSAEAVAFPASLAKRARTGDSTELSDALVTALDEGDFEGLCESLRRELVCLFFTRVFFGKVRWQAS